MVKKLKSRGPSVALAKAVLKKRDFKRGLTKTALNVEAKFREKGGYGKACVSVWEVPKGGIEKSPAYRKLLTRCVLDKNGRPPPPAQRDGAPLRGGYPLTKYPPNLLVDGSRLPFVPDDWAQVLKNTGPGGVYLGWLSPEGKFLYHRRGYGPESCVEGIVGRELTVQDGINAITRSIRRLVPPGADQAFFKAALSIQERRHIAPASAFHFAVVSARRATNESGQYDIMVIETFFKLVGVKPTWYVDEASLDDYKKLGVNAKIGGKLTPARNMALEDAKRKKLVCVQVSDDISKWVYYDCPKQNFAGQVGFEKANFALAGTKTYVVSPLAAAQFILAKMRSHPDKPHLGGVFPNANAAMTLGASEFGMQHFILGDFFVAEPSSPCRFDTSMTLKEDYDYTCSHIKTHGCVLRCNRLFIHVKHSTNAGGAVSVRDAAGRKEKQNIAILNSKWPGVFRSNANRKNVGCEVTMNWNGYAKNVLKETKLRVGKDNKSKIEPAGKTKVKKTVLKPRK